MVSIVPQDRSISDSSHKLRSSTPKKRHPRIDAEDACLANDPEKYFINTACLVPLLNRGQEILKAEKIEQTRGKYRESLLTNDYIVSQIIGKLEGVQDRGKKIERVLFVSMNKAAELKITRAKLKHNLPTLVGLHKCNGEDFEKLFKVGIKPKQVKAIWRRITNRRKKIFNICEELKVRADNIGDLVKELRKVNERLQRIKSHKECKQFIQGKAVGVGSPEVDEYIRLMKVTREVPSTLARKLNILDERYKTYGDAKNSLINHNIRLVVSIAKRYGNRGLSLADLIQEGNFGLMKAADKYSLAYGTKFGTYATWWVHQSISHALGMAGEGVRIPHTHRRLAWALERAADDAGHKNGYKPNEEELGREWATGQAAQNILIKKHKQAMLGDQEDRIRSAVKDVGAIILSHRQTCSIDQPLNAEHDDTNLSDYLESRGAEEVISQNVEHEALKGDLSQVLGVLDPRELGIITRRIGLQHTEPLTLVQVAAILSISKERVRQIEGVAYKKLRNPENLDLLKSHLD